MKCTSAQTELKERLHELLPTPPTDSDTVEDAWTVFRDAVFSAAEKTLGFKRHKHQDWFDQNNKEILTLTEAKRSAHLLYVIVQ